MSEAHKFLVGKAKEWLEEKGYNRISEEYYVEVEARKFRVDVVGFKADESIAIECGRTHYQKLEKLKLVFDKVKCFFYSPSINPKRFHQKDKPKELLDSQVIIGLIGVRRVFGTAVQIPAEVRKELGIKDDDKVAFVYAEDGGIIIKKVEPPTRYKISR